MHRARTHDALFLFFFNDTATTEIYTLSLHDALPILISGNHEHYGAVYDETYPIMKEFLKDWNNVSYLENEVFEMDGIRFVCATLWSDMKHRDPLVMETCRNGMNDYHCIYEDTLTKKPITPEFTVKKFDESLTFIRAATKDATDPTVIVTHHPPTSWCLNPLYRQQTDNLLNYAFYSDLETAIPENVEAWIHGHTHYSHILP